MNVEKALVLPKDAVFVPIENLPDSVRSQLGGREGDCAITRARSRETSKLVDAKAADLVSEFRTAKTIVEAVIRYSGRTGQDPETVLEEAFPLLGKLVQSRLLVPADSSEAEEIQPLIAVNEEIHGYKIQGCIQVLEDTEVYKATGPGGAAAVKIARQAGGGRGRIHNAFRREAAVLELLDGHVAPKLIGGGDWDGEPYLIMEWCSGVQLSDALLALRESHKGSADVALLGICSRVLDAYVLLHSKGVIHADVHPRNVLVDGIDRIRIVDFGLARVEGGADILLDHGHRGGVGFFLDPEYARAALDRQKPPKATALSEQYSLAALLYFAVTGAHYLRFSLEQEEMMRQIVEDAPLPFARNLVPVWPEVETILTRALSKDPKDRYPSLSEFAVALAGVSASNRPAMLAACTTGEDGNLADFRERFWRRLAPSGDLRRALLAEAPVCSVHSGAGGIAFAMYRLSCMTSNPELLSDADDWCTRAYSELDNPKAFYSTRLQMTPEVMGRVSPYHTVSGIHCLRALISQAIGDMDACQSATANFIESSSPQSTNLDVTLGLCSVLLGCCLLIEAIPDAPPAELNNLRNYGNRIFHAVWNAMEKYEEIAECRQFSVLGMAHGWAGLLYTLLRWRRCSGTGLPAGFGSRLAQLAELGEPQGRGMRWKWNLFPPEASSFEPYLPGWCNGTAGFVHLWTLAHETLHDARWATLAEQAAWNTWEAPTSLGDLCCGCAGRAYALLNLYKHSGQAEWLPRALALGNAAASLIQQWCLHSPSLYRGEVGVALLAADLDRPEGAAMPFFECEGWPAPG